MSSRNLLLLLFSVSVIACGQILFKAAARKVVSVPGRSILESIQANVTPALIVLLAVSMYAVSTVAWVQALRTTPLSVAFMFNSLAFIVVPIAGFYFFSESLPRFFVPGLVLILGGIFLVTRQ